MSAQPTLPGLEQPAPDTVTFVAMCGYCGAALTAVPDVSHLQHPPAGQQTWHSAEAWCYIAQRTHERDCPARKEVP